MNNFHTQNDFAPVVAQLVRQHGRVEWKEIYSYIENTFDLTVDDFDIINKGGSPCQRWKQIVENLSNNKVLVREYTDIVRVEKGFATSAYLEQSGIEVLKMSDIVNDLLSSTPMAMMALDIITSHEDENILADRYNIQLRTIHFIRFNEQYFSFQ